MNNSVELLKKAGGRQHPCIELDDLHEDVLLSIQRNSSRDAFSLKAVWFAAIPVLICTGVAAVMWARLTDPFNELMNQFLVVMR